jgi:myosin heavy subunit
VKLTDKQAFDARDALAKAVYGQLFNHIVANINANINCSRKDVSAAITLAFLLLALHV